MSVIFLITGIFCKDLITIKKNDIPLLSFRGILFIADFGSFFIAVNHLSLGTTLFLFYAGSILANYVYGRLILKEKTTKVKIISMLLAFIGLSVIYYDSITSITNIFILYALFAGICFGLETATSKTLTSRYSVNQVNLTAYIAATIGSLLLVVINKETITFIMSARTWLAFISFSLVGVCAFYTTLYGFKYIEAQKGSLILLAELLFALIIGFFLFQEVPNSNTVLGGIFILIALILPNTRLANS